MFFVNSSASFILAVLLFLSLATDKSNATSFFVSQGVPLIGSGSTSNSLQGLASALSGDASTVVVGGKFDSNYLGAAWFFTRNATSANGWSQVGSKIVPNDTVGNAQFGTAVSINYNATITVISGYEDSTAVGARTDEAFESPCLLVSSRKVKLSSRLFQ